VSPLPRDWSYHADALFAALQRFRTHPLQTWLTLAGLVVGTGSLILVVSLGLTGRSWVMSQIEGVGSLLVWANYQGTVTSGVARRLDDEINEGDIREVAERRDLFAGVTPLVILQGRVTVQARAVDLTVLGTTANYPFVRKNIRVLRGRFLDEDDVAARAKVCVVNRHLYEELFGNEDPAGKTVRTLGMTFAVIGEFEEPVDTLGQGDVQLRTIFTPITTSWSFTPTHRVDTLFAEAHAFSQMAAATAAIEDILRERHHAGSQYVVESMAAVVRMARAISAGLITVFALIAGVSVVVGGVGTMNIMLASVERRTTEVGLRRAVGARRGDIFWQFLLEALVLGLAGSSLGVLGGIGLPVLARALFPTAQIVVSALSAVMAFGFTCVVTAVFGILPAARAARLDPVEALRHE
jgi:putative ABC transport system permease protein